MHAGVRAARGTLSVRCSVDASRRASPARGDGQFSRHRATSLAVTSACWSGHEGDHRAGRGRTRRPHSRRHRHRRSPLPDGGSPHLAHRHPHHHRRHLYTGNLWLDGPGIDGAGDPYRESACTDLDAADGDFDALPGQDTAVCSNDVVQVITTADGTYEGRSVR
ncbi:SSI family serine proteinase inhibitor [Streptomyces roseolus]|uniref:SSI family serine proteinase inhibitor n=1 Tax=Streptomyces roseolus TaxID=67358 RepID=UPI003789F2ED